jgi:hypothetical protein
MPVDYDNFKGNNPVTLVPGGGGVDLQFTAVNPDAAESASLEFQANPAGSVTIEASINNNLILTEGFNSANPRGMRQNFPGAFLNAGGNVLTVTHAAGTNDITLKSFTVLYKS